MGDSHLLPASLDSNSEVDSQPPTTTIARVSESRSRKRPIDYAYGSDESGFEPMLEASCPPRQRNKISAPLHREIEYEVILNALRDYRASRDTDSVVGTLVLMCGLPGQGKTHVVRHVAHRAVLHQTYGFSWQRWLYGGDKKLVEDLVTKKRHTKKMFGKSLVIIDELDQFEAWELDLLERKIAKHGLMVIATIRDSGLLVKLQRRSIVHNIVPIHFKPYTAAQVQDLIAHECASLEPIADERAIRLIAARIGTNECGNMHRVIELACFCKTIGEVTRALATAEISSGGGDSLSLQDLAGMSPHTQTVLCIAVHCIESKKEDERVYQWQVKQQFTRYLLPVLPPNSFEWALMWSLLDRYVNVDPHDNQLRPMYVAGKPAASKALLRHLLPSHPVWSFLER